MLRFLILATIMSFCSLFSYAQPNFTSLKPDQYKTLEHRKVYYDPTSKKSYRVVNDDRNKGLEIEVVENGKKRYRKHGTYYHFYDGYMSEMITYNYGKKDGLNEKYNRKGVVKFSYQWKNNVKHGPWEQRNDRDEVVVEGTYANNSKEGPEKTFYRGKLEFLKHYENGRLHGELLQYSTRTGEVVERKIYVHGKLQK